MNEQPKKFIIGQLAYQTQVNQTLGVQQLQWDAQDQAEGLYYLD